jgi:hypothetical protein
MAVVLKTTEPETVPGVRIPPSPPAFAALFGRLRLGKPEPRLSTCEGCRAASTRSVRRRTTELSAALARKRLNASYGGMAH